MRPRLQNKVRRITNKPSDMDHLIALANCCLVKIFQTLGGAGCRAMAPQSWVRLGVLG